MSRTVYLDHAATTPLAPAVLDAMRPYLTEHFGNASSVHALGRKARVAVEEARERVAAVLGCPSSEVLFTSGGTEGNNAALLGALTAERPGLITSAAEHEAVLRPAERRAQDGHPVTILTPEPSGAVTAAQVKAALDARTGLVSVMYANNEVGTLSPIAEIAAVAREAGALMHTDAVQAAGLLPLRVDDLDVDLLTLSGHKMGGPKGVGVLFIRSGTAFEPLVRGGAQERRRRGGTENVASIVGCAEALSRVEAARTDHAVRLAALQQRLARHLHDAFGTTIRFNTPLDGVHPNPRPTAPHVLNVSFPPQDGIVLDGEMLLLGLDVAGVYVSSGSACTSGALEPSHVLQAIGVPRDTAHATVRFSLGRDTTEADIDYAADQLRAVVARMRG